MFNLKFAISIVAESLPGARIEKVVEYKNLYLFQVFVDLPGEEGFDPFFSVDKVTGEFRDFSILNGDTKAILELFKQVAQTRQRK